MKRSILLFIAIYTLITAVLAQSPIAWKTLKGGTANEKVTDMIITDSTYVFLSTTNSTNYDVPINYGNEDIWLFSLDKTTNGVGFSVVYGADNIDQSAALFLIDSTFYATGVTKSHEGLFIQNHGTFGTDIFSIKTNLNGNILDTNVYGGSSNESLIASKLFNGKLIWEGSSNSIDGDLLNCTTSSSKHQWICKTNKNSDLVKSYCNDTIQLNNGDLHEITNGYFLICSGKVSLNGGYTYPSYSSNGNPSGYSSDLLVLKYDTSFNIINIKNYGSDSEEGFVKSLKTNDNGFIILGFTDFIHDTLEVNGGIGSRDIFCVKIDSNANFQWSKCLGTFGPDEPKDIIQTNDGGYLIFSSIQQASGDVSNYYGSYDTWLAKIDSMGNLMWEHTYGGSNIDAPNIVREDSDGYIIIAGRTMSNDGFFAGLTNHGGNDIFIIKLAPWVGINSSEKTDFSVRIYPNPTQSSSSINLKGLPIKNNQYQLSIYNIQGQQLNSQEFNASYTKQIQLPQLSNGVYFIRLINEEGVVRTAKFIIN